MVGSDSKGVCVNCSSLGSVLNMPDSCVFLFRRDSGVPLRNTLLLGHDRGVLFSANGAFHTDLPPTAGE